MVMTVYRKRYFHINWKMLCSSGITDEYNLENNILALMRAQRIKKHKAILQKPD